jgi:hypothetical protein
MLAAASIRISGPSNVLKTRNMGTSQCPTPMLGVSLLNVGGIMELCGNIRRKR